MPEYKCFEDDAIKIIEKAIREGRTFRSKRDLVKLLVEFCNYEHEASAYRLIKKLETRGLLGYVSGYGYVLADREHDNIIISTCALLLDLVRPVKPVNEILREGFSRYYGEEMPGAVVFRLMERALEHVITSDERLIEEVKKAVPIIEDLEDLREKEDTLLNKYWDLIKERGEEYKINFIKEIERILELKPLAEPILYAKILLDELIPNIVKNNSLPNSIARECCNCLLYTSPSPRD